MSINSVTLQVKEFNGRTTSNRTTPNAAGTYTPRRSTMTLEFYSSAIAANRKDCGAYLLFRSEHVL